jgi:polysaccharide biosynthesis transport protein
MNISPQPDSFEPGDYLAVLHRRWWIVLVLVLVGLLAAAAYIRQAPKVYTATATVQVTANAANSGQVSGGRTSGGSVNMDSQAQVVKSAGLAKLVAAAAARDRTAPQLLKNLTVTQLSKKISVTVPANSDDLQVNCGMPSADAAAACANAFAAAYLDGETAAATKQLSATLATLTDQVNAMGQEVARLNTKLQVLPRNSGERTTTQTTLTSDKIQISTLNRSVGTVKAEAANVSAGTIITSADVPASPTSPRAILILPSGLLVALLIGLVAAFQVDRRDQRIHGARDIERYLDLPVLLSVAGKKRGTQPSLAGPGSRTGQAFAELADGASAALGEGNHVLVVAGTSARPGGGVAAANLAVALARTHSEVVLVCADLHASVIPELFGLGQGHGLAEVLCGNATVSEVARRPADFPRLRVVTPGVDTSFALYSFQHDATRDLISELRSSFPFVIIEAQASGEGGDTFALAEFAAAALIAVEVGKTKRPEVAECLRRLNRLRTTVLGAVLIPASSAAGKSRPSRMAGTAEQRTAPAERHPDSGERHPDSGERHPDSGSLRPPLKVGLRGPSETGPPLPGAVRTAGGGREKTPHPAAAREDPADQKTGS